MNDAVFISDLHLHPEVVGLNERFKNWIQWALENTKSVYILGDFFHAWAGDDTLDSWSAEIAQQLSQFHHRGIDVYFMVGNRDFLIGEDFAQLAKIKLITEPKVIHFGPYKTLLVHGDKYCTLDKTHQWFRCVTRHPYFAYWFLKIPQSFRRRIVLKVRERSQHRNLPYAKLEVVSEALNKDASRYQADVIIHGHTHRPMRVFYQCNGFNFEHIILSDWEENCPVLCYNEENGFYYQQFWGMP